WPRINDQLGAVGHSGVAQWAVWIQTDELLPCCLFVRQMDRPCNRTIGGGDFLHWPALGVITNEPKACRLALNEALGVFVTAPGRPSRTGQFRSDEIFRAIPNSRNADSRMDFNFSDPSHGSTLRARIISFGESRPTRR